MDQAVPGAVISGGSRQGTFFAGLLIPSVQVDLSKITGMSDLSFYASAFVVQGHGPTSYYVHSLSPIDLIEAPDGGRLADAFFEWHSSQNKIHIKLGQFGLDENFDQNPAGATFLDGNYTYRNIMAINLPDGGPAYPFESPGALIAVQAMEKIRLRIGLFSGSPAAPPFNQLPVQARNPNGFQFPLNSGVLVIAEVQRDYALPVLGKGTLLVGALHDTLSQPDLLFDSSGRSLAASGAGPARLDHGNAVVYVGDTQTLWQGNGGRNLQAFVRFAHTAAVQDMITTNLQGGLAMTGPIPARPQDTLAIAAARDWINGRQARLIREQNAAGQPMQPIPNAESDVELSYNVVITPWLSLGADFQYIVHPGGGIADPADPAKKNPNALIFLLPITVSF
ncbi:MAG TPA: carbohydrate porin [Acidocella sp.]|uniref:carbohydrate porin n=1 Tax=Acidiphilium sp. 20-67-58 TaxID=1970291 RepID=UPI000BD1E61B|nr:carbohydrate porin [Acidiphilium sp. 20-67-58]OYV54805.1 MAG: hypothetical protein B7Z76_13035 [Acidiphilium sp. 20-67-58]HQT37863.1 carbohydrate porin [Acidocella sp.]